MGMLILNTESIRDQFYQLYFSGFNNEFIGFRFEIYQ